MTPELELLQAIDEIGKAKGSDWVALQDILAAFPTPKNQTIKLLGRLSSKENDVLEIGAKSAYRITGNPSHSIDDDMTRWIQGRGDFQE